MMVFALSQARPGKTMADLEPYFADELAISWDLYKQGRSRNVYPK